MSEKLIWIDLETTGLSPVDSTVLEVACVITDTDLNELGSYEGVASDGKQLLDDVAGLVELHEASGAVLAGGNVGFDRSFISESGSRLIKLLHYGNLDVSSVRRFMEIAHPGMAPFQKMKAHRAMGDIRESIAELKYYRTITEATR